MQYRIFTIPMTSEDDAVESLNAFLRGHRIVGVDKRLVEESGKAAWTFCVEYLSGAPVSDARKSLPKVDYREVLNEKDFGVFSRLRDLRKELADKEKLPAYALFTNEQLARMVREAPASLEALGAIERVSPARVKKYGQAFLDLLAKEAKP
ncbi:MAG: superfamily II DNA helicase RecQ [Verrucomicrobiales bacterium]|jgi:superfamily II DNA helicase RecQ